jgi:hypothetical protein
LPVFHHEGFILSLFQGQQLIVRDLLLNEILHHWVELLLLAAILLDSKVAHYLLKLLTQSRNASQAEGSELVSILDEGITGNVPVPEGHSVFCYFILGISGSVTIVDGLMP